MKTSNKEGKNLKDIPVFWDRYLQNNLASNITNRKHTDQYVELGMCTDFNLEAGDFTYIIGMEVTGFDGVSNELAQRTFPEATYAVFTTPKVPHKDMVSSLQQTWKSIFQNGSRTQAMNMRALQSSSYMMSVAMKIRVSLRKLRFGCQCRRNNNKKRRKFPRF